MTRFLRLPDVIERVGLSRSTLYAMVARGEFPAPVKLGQRAIAWPIDRLETWAAEREAA